MHAVIPFLHSIDSLFLYYILDLIHISEDKLHNVYDTILEFTKLQLLISVH